MVKIKCLLISLCLLTNVDAVDSSVYIHEACINNAPDNIPKERALGLAHLNQMNAWFAHERFWAAGGVIDPHTYEQQRTSRAAFAGTPIAFLNDLSTKLDTAMRSMDAVPTPQSVEDLVRQSQQILLTIAAGTPGEDGIPIRLNPANAAEWQIIRKALFLALSVTEDPEKSGKSYLTPVYELANYYYQKTDTDAVKEYYLKLEAYGFGFSTFWKGLKEAQTNAAIQTKLAELRDVARDPLYGFIRNNPTHKVQRNVIDPLYKGAFVSSINAISVVDSRAELAIALGLHGRLNHTQVFKTLYPDLTMWAEYHVPSARAEELMGPARPQIVVPAGFQPKRVHLAYVAGRWLLKGINGAREHILWTQGASATAEFIGSLEDARGTHLFNFKVEGATAVIKTISLGYGFNAENDGTNVVVADGDELGLIESSAYPEDTDVENFADGSIIIRGNTYSGMRGFLSALRSSALITAPKIDLNYAKGYEVRTHSNGATFNFLVKKGQGIDAYNSVMLNGDSVALNQSSIRGRFTVQMYKQTDSNNYLRTDGTDIQTAYFFLINHCWHTDVGVTYAGSTRDPYEKFTRTLTVAEMDYYEAAKAPLSYPAYFDVDRVIAFNAGDVFTRDDAEYNDLLNGPHIWGTYGKKENTNPTFGKITYTEVSAREYYRGGGGGGFGGFGNYGGGGGFGHTVGSSSWAPLSSSFRQATVAQQQNFMRQCGGGGSSFSMNSAPASFRNVFSGVPSSGGHNSLVSVASSMIPGGVSITSSVDVGMGSRDGDVNSFVSASFTSGVDSLTLGASTSVGESGHRVGLESVYSGSGDNTSVLGSIHALTAASIMQLTDRRTDRLSVAPLVLGGLVVGRVAIPHVVRWSRTIVNAYLLAEQVREKAEANAKVSGESEGKSVAGTGGPDEDPEEEKKYKISDDNADATLPTGHRKPGEATPKFHTKNEPTKIGDTNYTGHALDEMRAQGLTPSVVEQAVQKGVSCPGRFAGTTVKYDPVNNVSVVVNSEGSVVTTSFGKLAGVL